MNSNIQSYVNDSTLAVPHSDPLSLCDLSSTFTGEFSLHNLLDRAECVLAATVIISFVNS
jgi:hypothetical protein